MRVKHVFYFILFSLVLTSCTPMSTEEFIGVSQYAFPVIGIILVFNLRTKIDRFKKAKTKLSYFSLKRMRILLFTVILLIVSAGVTQIIPDKTPNTPEELVTYGQRTGNAEIELEGLRQLAEGKGDNISKFNYYQKYIEQDAENEKTFFLIKALEQGQNRTFDLACVHTLLYDFKNATFYTLSLDEKEPVVCFLKGQVALYQSDSTAFVSYMLQEVENSGLKHLSYPVLAEYFQSTNEDELLYDLVKSDVFLDYLDFNLVGNVYYLHGDVYRYIFSTIMHIINHLSIYSFLGALVILLAYTVFLRQIDLFNRESWFWVFIMIGYGAISPFFVFPFTNFLEYNIRFNPEDSLLGNFLFYTLRVGLIEEYVKLFPFILLLLFTKKMKEPYDYIFYTALSALGFAFTENLLYFSEHGTAIIQTRGLLSVIGHAMFTSTVGYFMAYSRFKKRLGPPVLVFIFALGVAALLHGIFDFLLTPVPLGIVLFIFYFLVLIHVWAVMLNNCMNNSSYFDYKKLGQLKNFQYVATIALLLIIASQYFLSIMYIGKQFALELFLGAFYPTLYMVVFLSNTLGRFDFFKGYWESLLPNFKEVLFPRSANTNEYVGKHINITPPKQSPLHDLGTIRGSIVERKIYKGSPNWYMVQLLQPMPFPNIHNQILLIEFGDEDESLEDEHNNECLVYGVPQEIDYSSILIKGSFLKGGACLINLS